MMLPDATLDLLAPFAADARHSWSMGTFGAIGEFHRDVEETVRIGRDLAALTIVTDRGALRLAPAEALRAVAYDTLASDGTTWRHGVALCAPVSATADRAPWTVVARGADREAARPGDRDAMLFDLGVGQGLVSMSVRTRDPALIERLIQAEGEPLLGRRGPALMAAILQAQPHRVMQSPAGRLEVFTPIPMPGGASPLGPHTHLLPKLLATGKLHSANTPIPEGWQAVASCHLAPPWRGDGPNRSYDAEADALYLALAARFGCAEEEAVRQSIVSALQMGTRPEAFAWPATRRARTAGRIALRRLAVSRPDWPVSAWRAAYDGAPVEADEPIP